MFRRLPAGLPADPVYPADFTELGYFINEKDEIRNIQDARSYFKFFLTKNDRYNAVQREAMNECIRKEIYNRVSDLGLEQVILPLGTTLDQPHVPIFTSANLPSASRIIILFYEPTQDLGIFAHRIIGGAGGIDAGSVVDMVKYIQSRISTSKDSQAPGIILANTGQLRWSRKLKRAVNQTSWLALPAKSAVSGPYRMDPVRNTVPGHQTPFEHIRYIFNEVLETLASKEAKIEVIAVSESAMQVCNFLAKEEGMFEKWCASERISALAAVATYWHEADLAKGDARFAKWYRDKARAYITSPLPAGTFLAGPKGCRKVAAHGTNTYSLGEPYYSECMLPKGYKTVIDWFGEVAEVGNEYVNEVVERTVEDDDDEGVDFEAVWGKDVTKGFEVDEETGEKDVDAEDNEARIMEVDADE